MDATTSQFTGYRFKGELNLGVTNSVVILASATNTSSTLYLLAGPTTTCFGRAYNYAFTLTGPPNTYPGLFNVDFMRTRQNSKNNI